ncbi:MAG: GIY-YIG nuclease family protein [Chitinophagaceae bacterium]
MHKQGYVYIMTNKNHTVLYVGVTSNLKTRTWQHRNGIYPDSFTARYNCTKLVWFNTYPDILDAIHREKTMKGGSRKRKMTLINEINPNWDDLWDVVSQW